MRSYLTMARYCFYIDGFNVYYALKVNPEYRKYKWLNYRKLAEMVIREKDTVEGVYYFSTPISWKPASVARHKVYIKALRSCGVEYIKGRFKNKDIKCHKCHQKFITHEEKQTDVNIGVTLLSHTIEDRFDRAVLLSADSDLIPAIKMARKHAPEKDFGVMFPIGRASMELVKEADFRYKMSQKLLAQAQFDDPLVVGTAQLRKPTHWS